MIKIEHSIFALPFALASASLAARGVPALQVLALIILAMVSARSAAMAFNRYLDAEIDKKNPRTTERSIPAGRLTARYALLFTAASSGLFLLVAYFINDTVFYCAPVILFILLGYSYTKRFTSYSHFVLGLALGLSPLGAWLAVTGEFALVPILLGAAVSLWTAGFDIIYSCQDIEFDRKSALYSIPARIGVARSLTLAKLLHVFAVILLILVGTRSDLGAIYWAGLLLVSASMTYEHSLVSGGRLENVNTAFFTMNGIVSIVYGITTICAAIALG